MRKRTILTVSAVIAVGVIVVPTAANAANGGSWLLGRSNYESATTTVSNSAGTPLSLVAKTGYAPLKVNSATKVTNLNADKIDGLDSTSFLRSTGKAADANLLDGKDSTAFALRAGRTATVSDPDPSDPWGPVCPTGTVSTGGGGGGGGAVMYSGTDFDDDESGNAVPIPNSWVVIDTAGYVVGSQVTCYSPSGAAIPGGNTTIADPLAGFDGSSGEYEECLATHPPEDAWMCDELLDPTAGVAPQGVAPEQQHRGALKSSVRK